MSWKTVKKNGKTTRINISGKGNGRPKPKQLSPKQLRDLSRVGITHPGSLTDLGYHINQDPEKQKASLNKAINKYGKVETMRKLQDLYRLDYNRPKLRNILEKNIKYVEGK